MAVLGALVVWGSVARGSIMRGVIRAVAGAGPGTEQGAQPGGCATEANGDAEEAARAVGGLPPPRCSLGINHLLLLFLDARIHAFIIFGVKSWLPGTGVVWRCMSGLLLRVMGLD